MAEEDPITIDQVEAIARRKLPANVYNYYSCGADDQTAVERNRTDFDRLFVLPRVLRDVAEVDISTELLGHTYPLPIGIAPSAMQRLAGGEGEMDVARTAASMGLNLTLCSNSTTSLEDVMSINREMGSTTPFWFQLYLATKLDLSVPLIKRAEAAGYEALVLTVDTPILGNRVNERQTPLVLPKGLHLANIGNDYGEKADKPTSNRTLMDARSAKHAREIRRAIGDGANSASLTWKETISFLRQNSKMKIILKGVMAPEDAQLAIEHGVDAIVVSNHGGRQLDCAPSTIQALPEIVAAVRGRIPVILDGGIRHGSDVFKALALGADFVLVGRPALWGLAYNGRNGVETVMNILERELSRTMALSGAVNVKDVLQASMRRSVEGRLSKI
ncbi:hypothetical protein N7481_012918 [Penicillium waksmanii]|uniref:uncharacterized protein n=1 Tax=Penicillium waksmanii TaxID=69791 RepID=UPI002548334B|nr:uncharacterized protein N7481_012918 [Penicillium waksmanii]KAJ5966204.1 hypothetical protein N7481_012918 [Penicillium waksmanii]